MEIIIGVVIIIFLLGYPLMINSSRMAREEEKFEQEK